MSEASDNPFAVRTAIRNDEMFIGRQPELARILQLVSGGQPQSVQIIGDRRTGRSSLLHAANRRISALGSDRFCVVHLDLQSVSDAWQFAAAALRTFEASSDIAGSNLNELCSRLEHAVKATEHRVVVFLLDEFDALVDKLPLTFLAWLRSLANAYEVAFVIATTRGLGTYQSSGSAIAGSPFFNIFHTIYLGPLSRDESRELVLSHSLRTEYRLSNWSEPLCEMSGRLPLPLQVTCFHAVEQLRSHQSLDLEMVFAAAQHDLHGHFELLWREMTSEEQDICTRAAQGRDVQTNLSTRQLVKRGLLSSKDGTYQCHGRLFEQFVLAGAPTSSARNTVSSTAPVGDERVLTPGDSDTLSTPPRPASDLGRTIRVFVSYCHADCGMVQRLGILDFLRPLSRENIELWSDDRLVTGDQWDASIQRELKRSDIGLILVSHAYLHSPYCIDVEVNGMLNARRQAGLVMFPVVLSPCEWDRHEWLRDTQFQPRQGTVATKYRTRGARQQLFLEILRELRTIAARLRARGGGRSS